MKKKVFRERYYEKPIVEAKEVKEVKAKRGRKAKGDK